MTVVAGVEIGTRSHDDQMRSLAEATQVAVRAAGICGDPAGDGTFRNVLPT
jgi:hypothetical protein